MVELGYILWGHEILTGGVVTRAFYYAEREEYCAAHHNELRSTHPILAAFWLNSAHYWRHKLEELNAGD